MKNNYFNAVTWDFIRDEGYIPLKDREGRDVVFDEVRAFSKQEPDVYSILEINDGDRLSAGQIAERFDKCMQWMEQVSASGFGGNLLFVEVFVFYGELDEGKLATVKEYKGRGGTDNRRLVCITVELDSGRVIKYSDAPVPTKEIEGILGGRLGKDLKEFETLPDITGLLGQMRREQEEDGPSFKKTPATYILLGVNILVWLLGLAMAQWLGKDYLTELGVKFTPYILLGQYWRLFTPMFLHAGAMHLFANSYSLLIFGQIAERKFGTGRFVLIYLIAGLMGNIASFVFSPVASLGASGAVLGLGGALILVWRRQSRGSWKYSGRYFSLVIVVAINVLYGFANQGIDNYAHIGGVIGGYLTACAAGFRGDGIKMRGRIAAAALMVLLAVAGIAAGFYIWGKAIFG